MGSPTPRSRTRRAASAALAVALSLCVAELGMRGVMRLRGQPYDGERARELAGTWLNAAAAALPLQGTPAIDRRQVAAQERMVIHPYFSWQYVDSDQILGETIEYFRGATSDENFDVAVLGGSVAGGFGIDGEQRLIECLARDPRLAHRRIRVHCLARAAYKQPQLLFLLGYALSLGIRPDAVVELDGFNEAALATENVEVGTHPVFPLEAFWNRVARGGSADAELSLRLHEAREARDRVRLSAERFLASGAWRSCVLGQGALWRLQGLRRRSGEAQQALSDELARAAEREGLPSGPPLPEGDEARLADIVRIWEESSVSMASLCAGRGILYLHVLQPTLHDTGSKPLTREELEEGGLHGAWIRGVHQVYPRLREAGPRLAARGVAFYDASMIFRSVEERLYYDGCHFGRPGNERLAEAIAPALLTLLPPAPTGGPTTAGQ